MREQEKINILISFNDIDGNYTRHAAVTILSLLETNKKNKIKIYILSSYLPKENIDELKRIVNIYNQEIEFIIDDNIVPEELKKVIINKNKLTRGAWYRYFFQKYIKGIERILYIDCDVLVVKDVSEIYNMNMHGKAIAGYYVTFPPRCKHKLYGIKYYFNSGVMLIDTKEFDVNKITVEKIQDINTKFSKYFTGSDEEKINIIYKDDIFLADEGINYQITNKLITKGMNKATFIHCLQKPYIQYTHIPHRLVKLYYHYLDMTKWKGYPQKKSNNSYITYLDESIYRFLYYLLQLILGDKYFEKLILFKWKLENYKHVVNN